MLDLSKNVKKYEIKLVDGKVLKIKKPSQNLLIKISEMQDEIEDTVEAINIMATIVTDILNRNTNGVTFTPDQILSDYDIEVCGEIIKDYFKFWYSKLGE